MFWQFTSGHLSKEKEDINLKRYLQYPVHSSIIYNGQDIETACVQPMDKWINYNIYNRILLSLKNEILPLAVTWIDLKGIMESEISQTEKDTLWSLL